MLKIRVVECGGSWSSWTLINMSISFSFMAWANRLCWCLKGLLTNYRSIIMKNHICSYQEGFFIHVEKDLMKANLEDLTYGNMQV